MNLYLTHSKYLQASSVWKLHHPKIQCSFFFAMYWRLIPIFRHTQKSCEMVFVCVCVCVPHCDSHHMYSLLCIYRHTLCIMLRILYVYINIYLYICVYICIYIYVYICIYIYMYIYIYVCIYIFVYICIYLYICKYIYIFVHPIKSHQKIRIFVDSCWLHPHLGLQLHFQVNTSP